jgi:rfaE bifunctional protein kinase chain/domain
VNPDPVWEAILSRIKGKRVLIVGDVMLDEYIWGDVRRISPEAPVPVVEVARQDAVPGGAANAAVGVMALGGSASLAGVVGDDDSAGTLRSRLEERGVDSDGLVKVPGRQTTTKRRIVAAAQQVVRADWETSEPVARPVEADIADWTRARMSSADSVVLSDYSKGVVSEALAQGLIESASEQGLPVVVDPKGSDYSKYRRATVLTPNVREIEHASGRGIANQQDLRQAASELLAILGGAALLVTQGAQGMSLFTSQTDEPLHIAASARHVFDVTGAGDTVVATVALCLAGGATLIQAAQLATIAAGVVIGKVGTSTVAAHELRQLPPD